MAYKDRKKIINKKIIFKFLMYWYIGGSSYFFGTSVASFFLVVVCSFFFTQFIGNHVLISLISDEPLIYRITNRYLNLIVNLISNILIVFTIIFVNQYLYESGIFKFVLEPVTFGIVYCAFYTAYLKLAIKQKD